MGKNNGRKTWNDKQVFTTGEAAEVCKVSQQTIIRCFDSGRLQGFRVPGSRFRRIPRTELIRFMRANEIPADVLDGAHGKRMLIVDDDPAIIELLKDAFGKDERFELKTAMTGYDAGMLTESFKPHIILLDYMLPDINGNVVCQRIRNNPDLAGTKVIIVSGVVNQIEIDELTRNGANAFMKKPFRIDQLLEKVLELIEA